MYFITVSAPVLSIILFIILHFFRFVKDFLQIQHGTSVKNMGQ